MLHINRVYVASSDKGSRMAGHLPADQQFSLETVPSAAGMRGVE